MWALSVWLVCRRNLVINENIHMGIMTDYAVHCLSSRTSSKNPS